MRLLKTCLVLFLSIGIVLVSVPSLYADETSEAILKLLIKKGIVTQGEVDELKAEVRKVKPEVPKGLEERVAALEEKTKKPLVAVGEGDLNVSGYVQARYTNYEDTSGTDGFSISNAKITLKGHLVPEAFYKFEIGPHKSPSSSILYDAYCKLSYIPYIDVTAGQFKIPFAKEYLTSSSKIDTIQRSYFMNKARLANEYGIGAMASSDDLFDGVLEYYAAIESGRDRSTAEDTDQESFVGRVVLNPFKTTDPDGSRRLKGFQLAGATQIGKQDSTSTAEGYRYRYLGGATYDTGSIFMDKDYFKLQGEFIYQERERAGSLYDIDSYGWYVLANYKFPVSVFEHDMFLEPVLKFEQYEPDMDASRDREDWYTAGVNLHINKYVKWMTNYVWKEEQSGSESNNDQVLTQIQYKF